MKTNTLKTLFGSVAVASALFLGPVTASAADLTASSTFRINSDGIVRVLGAEVTSISGNIINAMTRLKNTVINWSITTDAQTKVVTTPSSATSTAADIKVGDKLAVLGTITALGSTMQVNATKVANLTQLASWKSRVGTVQSVNTANGTFVLKSDDKLITVQTNAQTAFKVATATSTNNLSGIGVGQKITVAGTLSADKTTLTATRVSAKVTKSDDNSDKVKKSKEDKKGKSDPHANGKGRDDFIHSFKTSFGLENR